MDKRLILFLLIGGALIISGCTGGTVCNPPYMRIGQGCCLDQNNNSICDRDEKEQKTPEGILEEYLEVDVNSFEEYITSFQNKKDLTGGYVNEYLQQTIEQTIENNQRWVEAVQRYLVGLRAICDDSNFSVELRTQCNEAILPILPMFEKQIETVQESINEPYKIKVKVLEMTVISQDKNHAKIYTVREVISNTGTTTVNKTYFLKRDEDNEWKIYDIEDERGVYSQIDIVGEERRIAEKTIQAVNDFYGGLLEEKKAQLIEQISKYSKDKCSQVTGVTVQEQESYKTTCYQSKYLDYAASKKDATICDEISVAYWLGRCYSSVAYETSNYNLCKDVEDISYTARGYYEDLSSRDICFNNYLRMLSNDMVYHGKQVQNVPRVCAYIRNEQLKEECLEMQQILEGYV